MYCAVATSACGDGYTYQNVRTLELASGANTICYLCKELESLPTLPPKPGIAPTVPPTKAPVRPASPVASPVRKEPMTTTSNFRPANKKNSNAQNENAVIAGISVGAVVLVALIVFVIHYFSPSPPKGHAQEPKDDTSGVPISGLPGKPMEEGQNQEDFVPQEDHSVT